MRADLGKLACHERVRYLGGNACAVAGTPVSRHCATMCVVTQRLQRELQDAVVAPAVRCATIQPARAVLKGLIVERARLAAGDRGWSRVEEMVP